MPAYTWFIGVKIANPVTTVLLLLIEIVVILPIRRHINIKPMIPLFAGVLLGMPFGVYGLARLDEATLRLALGIIVVIYLIYDLLLRGKQRRRLPLAVSLLLGMGAGAFTGAISLPGPLVLIYVSSLNMEKYELKASVLLMFMGFTLYKLPLLWLNGLLTAEVFRLSAFLTAPTLAGILLGMYAFEKTPGPAFANLLRALLAFSAVLLIVRAVA
jgi:uncharacterized protein